MKMLHEVAVTIQVAEHFLATFLCISSNFLYFPLTRNDTNQQFLTLWFQLCVIL